MTHNVGAAARAGAGVWWDAFLSYRRSESAALVSWLRRRMVTFRLPSVLARYRRSLAIYQDLTFERLKAEVWDDVLAPALDRTHHLIVVYGATTFARPTDGSTNWVLREVEHYLAPERDPDRPRLRAVIPVLRSGAMGIPISGPIGAAKPTLRPLDFRRARPWLPLWLQPSIVRHEFETLMSTIYDIAETDMPLFRREQVRRQRRTIALAATAATLAAAVTTAAIVTERVAESRALALESRAMLTRDPARALKLGAAAVSTAATSAALSAFDEALNAPAPVWIGRMAAPVEALAVSPDGTMIAAAARNGDVAVWDAATGRERFLREQSGTSVLVDGFQAAFSPDGGVLATSRGTAINLFEAATGKPIASLTAACFLLVGDLQFSPRGDLLLSVCLAPAAEAWDARTGARIRSVLTGSEPLEGATFSPDGTRVLLYGSAAGSAVWDTHTWKSLLRVTGHAWGAEGVDPNVAILDREQAPPTVHQGAWSTDGSRLLTVADDGMVVVQRTDNGRAVAIRDGSRGPIQFAAFSPGGRSGLAVTATGVLKLWTESGAFALDPATLPGSGVRVAAFSPETGLLLTANRDQTARLVDPMSATERAIYQGHIDEIGHVAFVLKGTHAVTASRDGSVRVWPVTTPRRTAARLEIGESGGRIESIVSAAHDDRLLTKSSNGVVSAWNTRSGRKLRSYDPPPITSRGTVPGELVAVQSRTLSEWAGGEARRLFAGEVAGPISEVAWDSTATHVFVSWRDGRIVVHDAPSGNVVCVLGRAVHDGEEPGAAQSASGRWIARTGEEGQELWDVARCRPVATISSWRLASFSPTADRFATVTRIEGRGREPDGVVHLFDAHEPGREILSFRVPFRGLLGRLDRVHWFPDGRRLLVVTGETFEVRDAVTGRGLLTLDSPRGSHSNPTLSPDGRLLAAATRFRTVTVWETERGAVQAVLTEPDTIRGILFPADPSQLLLVTDCCVTTWDLTRSEPVSVIRGESPDGVALSADGRQVAILSDGRVHVYDLGRDALVRLAPAFR